MSRIESGDLYAADFDVPTVVRLEPAPTPRRKVRWFDRDSRRWDSDVAYLAVWSNGRRTHMVHTVDGGYHVLPLNCGFVMLDANDQYD
jgi:hypothetical protein